MKPILPKFKFLNFRIDCSVSLITIGFVLVFNAVVCAQPVASRDELLKLTAEKVTIGLQDESLETAIKGIEQQSAFRFFYRDDDIRMLTHLNLTRDTRTIEQTLDILLQNTNMSFRQVDDNILLERKEQRTTCEISGRVIDSLDEKPVADASVFLSNSSVGAKTANDGTFNLKNVKPGKYELIVSIIGFETYSQTITVNDSKIALGDIKILPKQLILNEVTVKAMRITDVNRQKYLSWFKDEFLGTSNLALDCKIVNPEVLYLHFDEEQNILTASSSDFLLIENPDLGYKIKYLLKHFSLNLSDRNAIRVQFEGSVLFENMTGTVSKEQRWQKRRLDVYQNSSMHFLRAALDDKMEKEGFTASQLDWIPNPQSPSDSLINAKTIFFKDFKNGTNNYQDSLSFWEKKAALPKTIKNNNVQLFSKDDIIKPTNQKGIYALFSGNNNGGIQVTYNKYHQRYNDESTRLDFRKIYVLFDNNGVIIDPDALSITGAWSRNRVAELLPVDYEPTVTTTNQTEPQGVNVKESARSGPLKDDLIKLKIASDSSILKFPTEKLYLQFDKPYYSLGDTIWFKAYLLNDYLIGSDKSRIINIDIANDSNKVIKQYKLSVENGITWGNISIDKKDGFTTGTYTMRAYTNWMCNFRDSYFFYKSFYVASVNENSWLINKQVKETNINGNNTADVKLQLSNMDKKPFILEPLQLSVMDGNRRLFKQQVQTDLNGLIDVNFTIPQKANRLAIIAENEKKDRRVIIPITLNLPENTDVQFLPEGGNLVAGLPAQIGFKAIGEDGKSVQISGIITNNNRQQIAVFQSLHNGVGSFDLDVKEGESYTAKVTLPGGMVKDYALPAIKNSGTVLQVKNLIESDYLEVSVFATNDIAQSGNSYFLIGKARGIVCYAAVFDFREGDFMKRKIAKNLFPAGITHFTVMTAKYQPLNERLVFIDHNDKLNIQIVPDKSNYGSRDSVALQIKVRDNEGNPVEGNFSLAVTDDAQVKTDTLNNENIITRMLLTADLKGYVEEPGYYLSSKTTETWRALDNLLLTQGWVGYNWQQVLNPPAVVFKPEHEFMVKGSVFNVFNSAVKGTNVLLFSKTPAILMDTSTDNEGKFVFDHFPRVDTPIFVLKAVNKNGKSFNVGIKMDDIAPPAFTKPIAPLVTPWYVNSDAILLNYTRNNEQLKQQQYFPNGGQILKEVKITAKKIIKDSQNLNGPGNADLVLDEKDMEKAGKKNWLQLLQENIKGFREGASNAATHTDVFIGNLPVDVITHDYSLWYYVNYKRVMIFVDGIPLDSTFSQPPTIIDEKTFLESHYAEDIKGIELNYATKFADVYELRFISPWEPISKYAFIEITTRSGHGPFFGNTPGMYLYKPLPISWPKQFYKPKYAVKDTAKYLPDLRSTIDWEPNITTNANGEATVSFFTADKPSTYTLIIEGADMNGNLGYKKDKINIK